MRGRFADLALSGQVIEIDDMVNYYADDETLKREELLCFKVMLQRAKRLPAPDLEIVLRRINMFDQLLEEDPWVQELQAKSRIEGELKALRNMLINAVRFRFSALTSLAEIRAIQMEKPESLELLFQQIMQAPDEDAARVALEAHLHP